MGQTQTQAGPISTDAQAAVLRDADTLADWLAYECRGWKRGAELLRIDEATAEDFAHMPAALLVVLAFDAGQPPKVRAAALDAIAARYLAQPDTQAYAKRIQIELDEQREADERQDRAEAAAQYRRVMGYEVRRAA